MAITLAVFVFGVASGQPATAHPTLPLAVFPQSAELLRADSVLRQGLKSHNPLQIADAYYAKGNLLHDQSAPYDTIRVYYELALEYYLQTDQRDKQATVHVDLGFIYSNLLRFSAARKHLLRAYEFYEQEGDRPGRAEVLKQLALLSFLQEDYLGATANYERAYQVYATLRDTSGMIGLLWPSLNCYAKMGRFDAALRRAEHCRQLIEQFSSPDPLDVREFFYGRGAIHLAMNRLDAAWNDYQTAYDMARAAGSRYAPFYTDGLAYILQLRGDYAAAIRMHRMRIEMMRSVGEFENLHTSYFRLAKCYEQTGDFSEALHHQELGWQIVDSLSEAHQKSLEEDLLRQQREEDQAKLIATQELRLATQRKIQGLSWGLVLVFGLLLLSLIGGYRRNRRSNQLLTQLNGELHQKSDQNELLLREIHHRVKNNLQTVSSLLSLQSDHYDDPAIQRAVRTTESRVRSMALIHQKLYQGKHPGVIKMRDYLITLAATLRDTYELNPNRIAIEYEGEPLEFDTDTAIPVGLMANELVSNAFKYAFPEARSGTIFLHLHRVKDSIRFTVADNGIGAAVPGEHRGFGTELVNLLARQLGGTVSFVCKEGMEIRVRFPLEHR